MKSPKSTFVLAAIWALLSLACGDDDAGSKPTCGQICERIEAPDCPLAAPNCLAACEVDMGDTPRECKPELDALSRCFAAATFTCDAEGVPTADDCQAKLQAWTSCRENTGDGGVPSDAPSPTDICAAAQDDEPCDTCLKGACCEEVSACGDACLTILDCAESCEDETCVEACVQSNLDGAVQFANVTACTYQSCAGSCELVE